jgi:hypothetical protein
MFVREVLYHLFCALRIPLQTKQELFVYPRQLVLLGMLLKILEDYTLCHFIKM